MPVYEYQCKTCGHVFEREHAIGEKKKYRCPECSCNQTQKLVSQVGVIFKGSGFYKTDNRTNGGGAAVKKTKKSAESGTTEKSSDVPSPASEN